MDEKKPEPEATFLAKRRIEAALLADVYAVLVGRLGRDAALAVIEETVARAACQAGQAFAASAPEGPSLQHFAAVADQWQQGGALAIANKRQEADGLSFDVVRCCYAEAYREMGLPDELATRISCLRDQAFVAGYSPKLHLDRPTTIASGATHCPFTFTWEDA
ncbi:hypothetical protein DFW101_0639 [Solidesulfovibrio carbinoliphilus subsp. oakridgensis]|uniref:L-2-amino-thiazoline-4-carboxylic acid hydrolase n=1 Tax=Solidesulfovibrio carbinoliphilus subsp. oakridgensis TaxID=694327 RepID=G7QE00_9BACT|nr:L-2-amino-thiazoline-4-carboxylic acid hydrolase [Solidesulfovibrio carbinoliphilus]EHJ46656.1 hypothetical protein DFW101_0639 [Solidesulfovibrio carbinoliphilus subsp. oakridgensis]